MTLTASHLGQKKASHCQQLSSLSAQQHTALQDTESNVLGKSARENPLGEDMTLKVSQTLGPQ